MKPILAIQRFRTAARANESLLHFRWYMDSWSRTNGLVALGFVCALGLAGCGGGGDGGGDGGGGVTTAVGVFKDSNVSGLSYVSGNQAGVTGASGSFTFEVGQPVTFSVGGVTIGTAPGKSVVTPVDLVAGGNTSSVEVQNIARFLLMLDNDGDPSNGINISPAVQNVAKTFSQVNFKTADLATELASIVSAVSSADGVTHTLPNAATAKVHLESTFLCAHAGAFRGRYTGGDSGPFGVLVDATTGFIVGIAFSVPAQELIALSGMTSISFDRNAAFVSGSASTGATFNGRFTSPDAVAGTWANSFFSISGSFSGSRIGGASDAVFRFTGSYTGDDFGLFAFDVNSSDNVAGVAYSVPGDELFTLTGTVSGTTVSATASDGTVITGTLNKATGALNGIWVDNAQGLFGTYTGSGCKLN